MSFIGVKMDRVYKPKDYYKISEVLWRDRVILCQSVEVQTKGGYYTLECRVYGFVTGKREAPISPKFEFTYEPVPQKLKRKCKAFLRGFSRTRDIARKVSFV